MPLQSPKPATVRDHLRPLIKRRWLVLMTVIVATAATYLYYSSQPDVYRSTTRLFVENTSGVSAAVLQQQTSSDRGTRNLAALLKSRPVAEAVRSRLGDDAPAGDLLSHVTVDPSANSDFIQITAEADTASGAADLANAFAEAFIADQESGTRRDITTALNTAKRQYERLGRSQSVLRQTLVSRIQQLDLLLSLPLANARQVERAPVPSSPVAPRPVRNALFAFVVSLALAIMLAYGLERLDTRIRKLDDLREIFDAPLLATLPHVENPAPVNGGRVEIPPDLVEPCRTLLSNLRMTDVDDPVRMVLITSAMPGEGKSTVSRNLALTFADSGARTLLVDADLRRPSLAKLLGVDSSRGLTDVVSGASTLSDAVVWVSSGDPADAQTTDLALLPSGAMPPNPQALIDSERFRGLIAQAGQDFDMVIIDSPPLLAVSDAVSIASVVDGVVLVGREDRTRRDAALELRALLERIPNARLIGIVGDDLARGAIEGSGYGYYSYGYEQRV